MSLVDKFPDSAGGGFNDHQIELTLAEATQLKTALENFVRDPSDPTGGQKQDSPQQAVIKGALARLNRVLASCPFSGVEIQHIRATLGG